MSFRNYGFAEQENIKIEQDATSQLFLSSKFPPNCTTPPAPNQEVISKIADVVVAMHENCLSKCEHLQIFRDLNAQEQELLVKADKNTVLHTALAGILAVDSCFKALEKEEKFVIGNLLRANSSLIGHYKKLLKEANQGANVSQQLQKISDGLKYLTQQIQTLPSCKGRQSEIEKQMAMLESESEEGLLGWTDNESTALLSELQKENEMLKLAIREKDGHIQSLEGLIERNSKIEKRQERKNSIRSKLQASKNNQTQLQSQEAHHVFEELQKAKEELQQKNNIISKMNEQFASEMEKYNTVFKRLEDQNKMFKRYSDIDTVLLLEELEIQIEGLREQRQKDQNIINDIQRRFQGFSFNRGPRLSRGTEHTRSNQYIGQHFEGNYQPQPYIPRQHNYQFERRERIPSKYYSPNYSSSRLSPYDRPSFREREDPFYPQQTDRSRLSRVEEIRAKSRIRYQGLRSSRQYQAEPKSTQSINLLERVMAKGR